MLLTSNSSVSEWPKVFADDEKLTKALLDRLADGANVITPKGKSFRMRRRNHSQPGAVAPSLAALATAGDIALKTKKTKSK